MPLDNFPISDLTVTIFNPLGGTPAGSKSFIPVPVRGRVMECGFVPGSLVTSGITLAVLIGNQSSSVASNFVNVVTSTLGTFTSTQLYEGGVASVIPASPVYVNKGDGIQFVTSGGQSSTVGLTCYATIRRA